MTSHAARLSVGQLVRHRLFGYRGVVADVDATFQLTDEWYEQMARSQPPKDQPWYHVLVHEGEHTTYVAERNLDPDPSGQPIRHPLVKRLFARLEGDRYAARQRAN